MAISKDDFLYLQSIGVPYEGDVLGLGTVVSEPIVTTSNRPPSGAAAQGTFHSINYASVIMPGDVPLISEEELLDRIIHINKKDEYEVWDPYRRISINMGKDITSCNIEMNGNNYSIEIRGENGNMYSTKGDNMEAYLNELKNSFPWGRGIFDALGSGHDYLEYRYEREYKKKAKIKALNGIKKSTKQHYAYEIVKTLKKIPYLNKTKPIKNLKPPMLRDKIIPRVLRAGGRVLGVISGFLIVKDVINDRAFRVSHTLDVMALGICFAGGYGWVVGVAYFAIDFGVMLATDKSIGDHANQWVHDQGWFENGEILNLDSFFSDVEEFLSNPFSTSFSY